MVMQQNLHMETWLSGRKRLTANEVGCKSSRGFESLRLRILSPAIKQHLKWVLFYLAQFLSQYLSSFLTNRTPHFLR